MHCCSLKTTIEKHRVITSIIVAPVVHNSLCNNIGHRLLDFFIQFAGPALLGVSTWQYIKLMSYDPVLEISKFQIPAIIYITAGIASTFNGIVGCVGGVNERKGAIVLVSH